MKHLLIFMLFLASLSIGSHHITAQQPQHTVTQLFGKENPSKKEMKKAFRQLRRKAPNRSTRKKLKEFEKEYYVLLETDQRQLDSMNAQKARIEKLQAEVQAGERNQENLKALRAENDSLAAIMRNYVKSIDSLNTLNAHLESVSQNIGNYYFNLSDFVEPKIYLYEDHTDPSLSQYWKYSAVLEDSTLITEAFDADFNQFKYSKEKYDSIGSKALEEVRIIGSDLNSYLILESDIIKWDSKETYALEMKNKPNALVSGSRKTRVFIGVDSIEVLGEQQEVICFQDEVKSYNHRLVSYSLLQQSFYAKGLGLVRYIRTRKGTNYSITFSLKKVLSEAEWLKLQE